MALRTDAGYIFFLLFFFFFFFFSSSFVFLCFAGALYFAFACNVLQPTITTRLNSKSIASTQTRSTIPTWKTPKLENSKKQQRRVAPPRALAPLVAPRARLPLRRPPRERSHGPRERSHDRPHVRGRARGAVRVRRVSERRRAAGGFGRFQSWKSR